MNIKMNKSLGTNLISAAVFGAAYVSPEFYGREAIATAGLFALSGAFTNWLAVFMLFEKVPGLYGSGVVEMRFGEFKNGIRNLILKNFFTEANFATVAKSAFHKEFHFETAIDKINFDDIFDGFVSIVQKSSFGGMLNMVGGAKALEPLREPFKEGFREKLVNFMDHLDIGTLMDKEKDFSSFRTKIETMIDVELDRLTPKRVKELVEQMIRKHLGWLVIWGGVFGGLIGLISAFAL